MARTTGNPSILHLLEQDGVLLLFGSIRTESNRFDGKEWVPVGSVISERNPEGNREDRFFAAVLSCARAAK
jgi:hypothetical protein